MANGASNKANSTYSGFNSSDLGDIWRMEFQIMPIKHIQGSIPPIWARFGSNLVKEPQTMLIKH